MKTIDYQASIEAKITFELQELARLDERREVALSRLEKYRRALYRELYDLDMEALSSPTTLAGTAKSIGSIRDD